MKTILRQSAGSVRMDVLKGLTAFACAAVMQAMLSDGRVQMPQKRGNSLLSLISEDTRMVLSSAMVKKTDDYFHGGVTAEGCTLEHHAKERLQEGEHHHHKHDHEDLNHSRNFLREPFFWINSQIHAQEHRHLEKERSVELLPWFSAAVAASPHNIQAYEIGSYVLNRMTDKPELSIKFLKQGIEKNPENVSLELSLAEIYFNTLKDRKTATVHLNRALRKSLAKKGELTEDDRFMRLQIYHYLGVIARDNHDVEKLKRLYTEASVINPHQSFLFDNVRR
ncbi:MAG: hypothetical protein R6V06_08640 [Kiritimatiellia bacterium]